MPSPPQSVIYDQPDLEMELNVFQRGKPPGRATLRTLRSYSANVEAGLDDRLRTEAQQRKDADAAEVIARTNADNSEAQARANADAALGQRIDAEASTRAQADTTEANARQSADNSLSQRITDEATARQNADTQEAQTRAAADNAEITARTNADAGLQSQVAVEVKARQDGDASLQSQVTTEISDRKAADAAEAKTRGDADAAEATARTNADANLQSQINAEVTARANADTAEATARAKGDTDEAKTRSDADTALQTQITALKNTIVPFVGVAMTLPAGLSILAGKSTRTITVTGLKKNDNLVVTPNATLPANISMGEAYCATDGALTVVLINSATLGLSITTAQTIPLGVIALRP